MTKIEIKRQTVTIIIYYQQALTEYTVENLK